MIHSIANPRSFSKAVELNEGHLLGSLLTLFIKMSQEHRGGAPHANH